MIKCRILFHEDSYTTKDADGNRKINKIYKVANYYIKKENNLASFKDYYRYSPFVKEDFLLEYDAFINGGVCTFPYGEETDIVIIHTEFVESDKEGLCEGYVMENPKLIGIANEIRGERVLLEEIEKESA